MQEQPTIQAQACFGGCLLHEGAGGANWSRCKSLGEGGISAHAREAGGGGGASRSQSAPHMHVLVCICSNARQFKRGCYDTLMFSGGGLGCSSWSNFNMPLLILRKFRNMGLWLSL